MLGRCRLVALLLPLLCHSHSLADVSATANKGICTLQNELMRLEIDSTSGARIRSWQLLPSGREMVALWQDGSEAGGALGDRPHYASTRYDAVIVQPGPTVASIRFEAGEAAGLKATKTIVLAKDSPTLRVRYEWSNGTQAPQPLQVRSFLLPGGRPRTDSHLYWVNTADGGISGRPSVGGQHAAASPATAAIWDKDTGDGVLVYAPGASAFDFGQGGDDYAGMEVQYGRVPAGQMLSAEMAFTCVSGAQRTPDWGSLLATNASDAKAAGLAAVPGWRDEAVQFAVSAADRQRGFWLSIGGATSKQRLPEPVPVDLPMEAARYVPITVNALQDISAPVRLDLPPQWESAVRGYFETPGNDRRELLALSEGALDLGNGSAHNLWLRIDSSGAEAGDYDIPLQLSIGQTRGPVPIHLKVWPVREGQKRPFHLRGYSGGYPSWTGSYDVSEDQLRSLEAILRAYSEMGGDVLDWTCMWSYLLGHTKIAGTDDIVADIARNTPERMDLANLPDLDFSYYDPWFELARRYGVTRLDTYMMVSTDKRWERYLLTPALGAGRAVPGTPEADGVIVWFFDQMRRYLVSQGMEGMFCKISDEMSQQDIPHYIETAKLAQRAGWRPFTTITGMIARTAADINTLDPYCDLWQLSFSLKDDFQALRNTRMKLSEEQIEVKGPWKRYSNGGAQNTWSVRVFGEQSTTAISAGEVESFVLLEDGRPLQAKGRSPWGNKDRGVVITAGGLKDQVYVSPSDDQPPDKHRYVLQVTVRRDDPSGASLVAITPTDEVWTYGGGSKPFRSEFERGYFYPIVVLYEKLDGFGQWAFYHWNATERIIWVDEQAQVTVSPVYCGYRDGWHDCLIFSQLPDDELHRIVGTEGGCSLRVAKADGKTYQWTSVVNADDPLAINQARARALSALATR